MDFTGDLQASELATEAQTRQSTMDESIVDAQAYLVLQSMNLKVGNISQCKT